MSTIFNILILAALALLFLIFWGASVAGVYWDVQNRKLTGSQRTLWVLVTALLPLLGFLIYMVIRVVEQVSTTRPAFNRQDRGRFTMVKRTDLEAGNGGTIAAADLLTGRAGQGSTRYLSLEIVAGPNTGEKHMLENLPVIIGRGLDADIRLDEDLGVSRRHAEIYEQNGVLRIRDLNSAHGTTVNGYNIQDKGLDPGDQVHLGHSLLLIRTLSSAPGEAS